METKIESEKSRLNRKLPVYNMQGVKIEEITSIFNGKVNPAVLSQAITMYLANQRLGLASTKTRGEVSGGGKKPWRQKGTGRARAGSIRSPLWRHGGIVFGPHPRDFHYQLPAKIRNLALLSALNEKSAQESILVLDKIEIASPKSKEIEKFLDNLKVKEKAVLVFTHYERNIQLASRNMPWVSLALAKEINAHDALKAKKIIFVKDALLALNERLAGITNTDRKTDLHG